MEKIRTDSSQMRYYLDQIGETMHPGDYTDNLVNIVHYALVEAQRISRELGTREPMTYMLYEFLPRSAMGLHLPDDMATALRGLAEARGLTPADVATELLRSHMEAVGILDGAIHGKPLTRLSPPAGSA